MKAIILAAGRGSRLQRLTDEKPKCMVHILGKPIIEWQTTALKSTGVTDITVVCGYQKDKIEGDYQFLENPHWAKTNMVSSLACAKDLLQRAPYIISYSDIICQPDHISKLTTSSADIAITYDEKWQDLWSCRFENPIDDAETFRAENGFLMEIGAKASSTKDIFGQYMGLIKLTPKGWKSIMNLLDEKGDIYPDQLDMTSLLAALLERDIDIAALPVSGGWVEIDNQEEISIYETKLKPNNNWSHDWRY